jgi:hypothetical protein
MKTMINSIEDGPPLQILIGHENEARRDMFIHVRENINAPSLVELDDGAQREALLSPDFLRMTVVRNPYTRVLSAWDRVRLCYPTHEAQYLAIKGQLPDLSEKDLINLQEFINYLKTQDLRTSDAHWSTQTSHLFMDALDFTLVGKLENMEKVLLQFLQHVGKSNSIAIERRNVSHRSSASGYSPGLARQVYGLYVDDFERLSYSADDYPVADPSADNLIPEWKYEDEIVERNILLSELYNEVWSLRERLRIVDRLHLTKVIDALSRINKMSKPIGALLTRR